MRGIREGDIVVISSGQSAEVWVGEEVTGGSQLIRLN